MTTLETQKKIKPVDENSKTLIYKRFQRDLGQVYTHFRVDSELTPLDKDRTQEVLVLMGFLVTERTFDKELFETLWKDLLQKSKAESEENEDDVDVVMLGNLKMYMLAIQNIQFDWMH